MIECRTCAAGMCSHGELCSMLIRWYDDPWDGTFWRRCECSASIDAAGYPVTITRVEKPDERRARLEPEDQLTERRGDEP